MTPHRLSTLTVIGISSMALACSNPSPSPAPAPGPAPQASTAAAAASGPHGQNTIIFTWNTGHPDPDLGNTPCIGTATTYRMKVMRRHQVKWHLDDDNYNGCPDFDPTTVTLVFTDMNGSAASIWVDPDNAANTTATLSAKNTKIDGKVADSAADGRYKYVVYYNPGGTNYQASPDPEIDVQDTCDSCGGPGGNQ